MWQIGPRTVFLAALAALYSYFGIYSHGYYHDQVDDHDYDHSLKNCILFTKEMYQNYSIQTASHVYCTCFDAGNVHNVRHIVRPTFVPTYPYSPGSLGKFKVDG